MIYHRQSQNLISRLYDDSVQNFIAGLYQNNALRNKTSRNESFLEEILGELNESNSLSNLFFSVLVLTVLVFRFRDKYSRRLARALWIVVILRMVIRSH